MADEFVDELLFAGEAPLKGKIVGSSGFAEPFTSDCSIVDILRDTKRGLPEYFT
jgi:hypothetical protein